METGGKEDLMNKGIETPQEVRGNRSDQKSGKEDLMNKGIETQHKTDARNLLFGFVGKKT